MKGLIFINSINGYLPWNKNSTASAIFSDFWAFAFPGVKSYS